MLACLRGLTTTFLKHLAKNFICRQIGDSADDRSYDVTALFDQ
jgi:hypothetical protein